METRLRRGKDAGRLDGTRDSWSRDLIHLQRSKRVRERVCVPVRKVKAELTIGSFSKY